jgi:hypothetical protein
VIEAFKGYDNFLAVFAGNEVINDAQSSAVSPRYQKAVIRDMKNYIAAHVSRPIPVGYSAADDLKVILRQERVDNSTASNFPPTCHVAMSSSTSTASIHINVLSSRM